VGFITLRQYLHYGRLCAAHLALSARIIGIRMQHYVFMQVVSVVLRYVRHIGVQGAFYIRSATLLSVTFNLSISTSH